MQQLGAEADERDQLGAHVGADRPARPIVNVGLGRQVHEPVRQRFAHARNAAVRIGIARCENGPTAGEEVFADLPLERQLQARVLHQLRRAVQFVEEDDAIAVARADRAATTDVHVVKAQLATWIVDVRSVSSDPLAQKSALSRSYALTAATATIFLNDYYRQHSPFGQNRTVAVLPLFPI